MKNTPPQKIQLRRGASKKEGHPNGCPSFSWCARGESKVWNQLRNCEDFLGVSGLVGSNRRPFADLPPESRHRKYGHLSCPSDRLTLVNKLADLLCRFLCRIGEYMIRYSSHFNPTLQLTHQANVTKLLCQQLLHLQVQRLAYQQCGTDRISHLPTMSYSHQ